MTYRNKADNHNMPFAKKSWEDNIKITNNIKDVHVTFNPSSDKKERYPLNEIDQNIKINKETKYRITPQPFDFYKQSPELIPK